jgi:DNA-binding beta-propeller fold protein YncE
MKLVHKQMICRALATTLLFVSSIEAQTLYKVATIDLPGPKGQRFDYLTMDDEDHWLLSAHLGPGILYVIDVRTNKLVKAIPGVPGITGLEYVPGLRKVYTSDWGEEKIDPASDIVMGTYPVDGCRYNHGMAVDSEHHRAFLLCNGTNTLTVFALDTHKAITHLPIPTGADVVKFDPGLGRIYAACLSGFISVFQEDDANHYRKLEDFAVQKMVHSLAVDTTTHRVYAPEQQENGRPVARMVVYEAVGAQKH